MIVQVGVDKLPDLPDVPAALDLVTDAGTRSVLELILIRQEIGRPIALPPGVPVDRVAILRRAFEATLRDRDFLAEAEKAGMEVEPLTGDQVATMLQTAYGAPQQVVARMVELVAPPGASAK